MHWARRPAFLVLHLVSSLLILAILPSCASKGGGNNAASAVADIGWPRTFSANGVTYTVYQPQLKSWDQVQLVARSVVAAQANGAPEPTYGTMTVTATTVTDKVTRLVSLENLSVQTVNFPGNPGQASSYQIDLNNWLVTVVSTIALDRLESDLAILNAQKNAAAYSVDNTPPQFLISYTPAILVLVQGSPVLQPVPGTAVKRVVNSHALLLQGSDGTYYLHLWDGFVQSASLSGPWTVAQSLPPGVNTAQSQAVQAKAVDLLPGQKNPETGQLPSLSSTPLPTIYVATQPTSLTIFAGQPVWAPLSGTQLKYATNTVANVFQYATGPSYYILTSGRWFTAGSLSGPWSYVPNDGLPSDFSAIPVNSPKENVLASVAGTPQAQEAVIANGIPQMSRVELDSVQINPPPAYDGGSPKLQPIDGTPLTYAANCAIPVIQVSTNSWYALQNGIWFNSGSAFGPWGVSATVPPVIYTIPVTSPLHWVTYVKVYRSDASYVWAGYTPGYLGTVVNSSGVVVYGTGYIYSPYVGTVYVPAPVTYGYDASLAWTPWAGWGYGFAAGWAWAGGWNYWCCPPPVPYWGAYPGWGYNAYGGVTAWGPGGWAATTGNVYSSWGNWSGVSHTDAGFNAWTGREGVQQWGHAYNSVTGTMAVGTRGAVENVYNGNYAAAARGAAYNPSSGIGAYGTRGTIGNANTGWSANYAHGTVGNPTTGNSVRVGGIQASDGNGVYHVGNTAFADDNGNIYRNSSGSWQKMGSGGGGWSSVNDSAIQQSLHNAWSTQSAGSFRSDSWGETRSSFGGDSGWGDHSWGGGGGWGNHSWGGGGGWGGHSMGGFGGFRGGGGFRR